LDAELGDVALLGKSADKQGSRVDMEHGSFVNVLPN
jgi:hypothetical protein